MKLRSYFFLLFIVAGLTEGLTQRMILDRVVAKVGNEVVLYSDVEEKFALWKERGSVPEGARCTILESLLVTDLLVHHAVLDSVEISEDNVERQLQARIDQILNMMGGEVSQFEEYYGMSIAEAKNQTRTDLRKKLLSEKMRAEIIQTIEVTPSEVIEFFNQIPRDSLPYFNSEVELGEIVYNPPVNEEERSKAVAKAEGILDQIKSGADFEELASKFSDDFGSRNAGGNLGWTKRGSFVPEFEGAAFRLEEGEVSDLVESEFGFHIIQLLQRAGNRINSRHILIKPRITDADLEQAEEHLSEIRESVMQDSISFAEAVRLHSDKNAQSYTNSGRMVNPKTGDTFWETGDVDSEIFFAIDTMNISDVSSPLKFRSPTGDVIYRLVQLQSRTSPHRASLEEDYSKIVNAAKESKKNQAFNEWIEERIANTYILVNEHYGTCEALRKWNVSGIRP